MTEPSAVETPAPTSLSAHLQQLTETLAGTHTQQQVFAAALSPALAALNAVAGAILLLDPQTQCLSVAALQGHDAQTVWQDGPRSPNTPAGDVLSRGQPVYFEHAGALKAAYPHLEAQTGGIASVATAVLPLSLEGQQLGVLILDFKEPHHFTSDERHFLTSLASQCALALSRAQLIATLDTRVQERSEALEAERVASQAFITFSQQTATTTEILVLAEHAIGVLRAVLQDVSVAYYELQDGRWRAQCWSGDISPAFLQAIQAGFTPDTPRFANAVAAGHLLFVNGWQPALEQLPTDQGYTSIASYPFFLRGQPHSFLSVGRRGRQAWNEREQAVVRAVGQALGLALERTEMARQLQLQREEAEQRNQVLEGFAALSTELNIWQHPYELIRQAQEIVLSLLSDGHALYWEPVDGLWRVRAKTGEIGNAALEAAIEAGLPVGRLPTLDHPWQTGEPEYQSQYVVGRDLPAGLTGHLQSVATLPVFQGEILRGVLSFTLHAPHVWRAVDQVVLETVQQSLSLALDRLHQQRVAQQEQAALQTFVQFTEAAGQITDLDELARLALDTLRTLIPGSNVVLTELTPTRWVLRHWTDNLDPELLAMIRQHGFPLETPVFAELLETREPSFTDGWDETEQEVAHTRQFQAVAHYPVMQGGRVVAAIGLAVTDQRSWTEQQQAIIRSVGRSFTLLYDRIAATEESRLQHEEAQRRAQILEAFMLLTRDQMDEADTLALIRRAQELVLSLLPPGLAAYYEPVDGRWQLQAQTGDAGRLALQEAIEAGFLLGETPSFDLVARTGEPSFVEVYAGDPDVEARVAGHIAAHASLPLIVHGQMRGIFNVPMFEARRWAPADRALLTTAVHSLGLVIERAERTAQLARANRELDERTKQLEHSNEELKASNAELEAFTYSASHDLRTPVRHVMGFAELAEKALEKTPNERVGQHLKVVKQAAQRMTDLIDGMLVLSRSGRQELNVRPVDLNLLATQARRDVAAEFGSHPVRWQIGHLPTVHGDPQLLQQVVSNLFSNAVKYSARRERSEVKVWSEEGASEWTIRVQDNGVGFDPNYTHKLYGIFQRLHNESNFKGTGIGLATVKRIVLKHGGQVFAESDGRTGATFGFSLPK